MSWQSWGKIIFILILIVICGFNGKATWDEKNRIREIRKILPHQVIGTKLTGLEKYTKDIKVMGYYTDAAQDNASDRLFAYAQHLLAPTVLDHGNLNHEYVLLVMSSEEKAAEILRSINAEVFKQNPYGIILAKRRP